MKVLYFDPKFAPLRNAVPSRASTLAPHLARRGHDVTVVARDPDWNAVSSARSRRRLLARERVDGVDVLWLRIPYDQSYSKATRLLSFGGYALAASAVAAARIRADVVYASSPPMTAGIPGAIVARAKRAPFVFELQDLWPAAPVALGFLREGRELAAAEWLERRLYESSARLVVCSAEVEAELAGRGVPREKLVFVPNFAETELFRPGVGDDTFRARHGLEDRFVAVYSGAMGVANGVYQLADAARALKRAGDTRVAIVVVGTGSERPALERRVRDEGLDNLVLLPPVARAEMPRIVGAADVTLTVFAPNPVLRFNSPNKFFDSLAAGKPVLVNLDGWLRRVVEENDVGAYVPAGDPDSFARTLVSLAGDPERVRRMGENARTLATTEFAWDMLADRIADLLETVARTRAPATAST